MAGHRRGPSHLSRPFELPRAEARNLNLSSLPTLPSRRPLAWVLPVLATLLAGSLGAQEFDVENLSDRWRWRSFETEPHLPVGVPTALGHDSAGMIYVGTAKGVYRYTGGYRWEHVPSSEDEEPYPVLQILESDRHIYLRTRDAIWSIRYGELYRVTRGGNYLMAAGPHGGIHVIDRDSRELLRIRVDENSLVRVTELPFARFGQIRAYAIDEQRIHWLATSEGLLRGDLQSRVAWTRVRELPEAVRGLPATHVELVKFQPLYRDQHTPHVEGNHLDTEYQVWASFSDGRGGKRSFPIARRGRGGASVDADDLPAGLDVGLASMLRDGRGGYFALTDEGKLFYSSYGDRWEAGRDLGIGSAQLSSGLVDSYGLLWFAYDLSMGVGSVAWFDPLSRRWERVPGSESLRDLKVLSMVEASDGSEFLGTVGGLYQLADGEVTTYTTSGEDRIEYVTGLAEDPEGNIWISSGRSFSGALRLLSGDGPSERPAIVAELSTVPVLKIIPDRGRDLWFLPTRNLPGESSYRLFRLKFSRFGDRELVPFEMPVGPANDFLEAQDGSRWVATENGLVVFPEEGPSRIYQAGHDARGEELLRHNRIWALAENRADGSIWLSYVETGFGVSRYLDGRFTHHDQSQGLRGSRVWSIETTLTSFGYRVWVGTQDGLSAYDGDGWYNYPLPIQSPDERRPEVWTLSRSRQTEDFVQLGTLGAGAFRFRLENPRRPRFLGGLEREDLEGGQIRFRWDARDFKDQTPPDELFFRYRIDGSPFSDFTRRRSVTYQVQEPGTEHTLQVEVRDRDGVVALQDLSYRFKVEAPPPLSPLHLYLLIGGVSLALLLVTTVALRGVRRWRQPLLRLRDIFGGLDQPVIIIDQQGRIVEYNGACPELLLLGELEPDRLQGLPVRLIPIFHDPEHEECLRRVLEGEVVEFVIRGREGAATLDVHGLPVVLRRAGGRRVEGAVLHIEDATRRVRQEDDRRRQKRMRVVRELTRRLSASLAGVDLASNPQAAEFLRPLLGTLEHFGGARAVADTEEVDVAALLESLLDGGKDPADSSLKLPAGCEVDFRSPTGLWSVRVAEEPLRAALLEVLRNGVEALRDGGKLTVRFANRRIEEARGDLAPGRYVEIYIADTGLGLDALQLECAFDPFFTTKDTHAHRGLGLSHALGVISSLGGDIWIDSRPGEGTEVRLFLPARSHG